MLETARNVAIIMLLALVVAVVPGGDAAAEAILVALSMAFLAAIAWFVARLYRDQQLTLATMPDSRRAILFGARRRDLPADRRLRGVPLLGRRDPGLDRPHGGGGRRDLPHLARREHLLARLRLRFARDPRAASS